MSVNNTDEPITFPNCGIQRVKVKEVFESLQMRETQKIDPFNQGFEHMNSPKSINLHDVRLCFQVGGSVDIKVEK